MCENVSPKIILNSNTQHNQNLLQECATQVLYLTLLHYPKLHQIQHVILSNECPNSSLTPAELI